MKNLNPRTFPKFNLLGFWTLYFKEVKRFTNIITQTIFAPVITSLLFLFIFKLSIGRVNITVGTLSFTQFLIPGLIIMSVLQNSFASTSSSLVSGKMMGSIVDLVMPPLSSFEILMAMMFSGITRGVLIGLASGCAMYIFADIKIYSIGYTILFTLLGSSLMSIVGLLAGIWSEKWDNIAAVSTYVITPLSFLSGTFYSVDRLPPMLQDVAYVNPFFFIIDGFRYGMTGYNDNDPVNGALALTAIVIVLGYIANVLLKKGWRLRA